MTLDRLIADNRSRILARRFAAERGLMLQRESPEIAVNYRKGMTLRELVAQYRIVERFDLEPEQQTLAINIVYRALAGSSYPEPKYEGLLTPRERRRIGRQHIRRTARANGKHVQELGVGIFAATPEERRRYASIGGKVGGARVKELGVGYCGLTPEERREASRKGTIALGLAHWERDELAVAYLLSQNPEYQDPRSGCGVRHRKVAAQLNTLFHEERVVRSGNAVSAMWRRHQTRIQDITGDPAYLAQMRKQYLR